MSNEEYQGRGPHLPLSRRQVLKGLGIGGAAMAFPGLLDLRSSSKWGETSSAARTSASKTSSKTVAQLNWAIPASTIVGLDIATAFVETSVTVGVVALEGLLTNNDQLLLEPLLATSWTYDEPSLKYVFTIRQGVHFWDGTPMTVEDVAYSLTRHITPKVASQIGGYFVNVESFTATGPNTLTIYLKRPDPTVQHSLAFAPILSKAFAQKVGKALGSPGSSVNIMGTGPYQVTAFPSSTSATVERFKGYWGPAPAVEKCVFSCIGDPTTRKLAVESGSVSGAFTVPLQDATAWSQLSGVTTHSAPGLTVVYMSFDMSEPPWNDLHVRRAFAYATDQAGMVKAFLDGAGTPAKCMVPPQQWGSVLSPSKVDQLYASLPSYPYSISKAKKELAQSSVPRGFTTNPVLIPSAFPAMVDAFESLSLSVKKLGIDMPVTEATTTKWLANIYAHGKLGLSAVLAAPDYADPADYPNILFPSADATKDALNTANFKNATVDKLLNEANAAANDATRAAYLGEVLRISMQLLPYYPLWWQNDVMAIRNEFVYKGFTGLFYNQNWLTHISAA